MSNYSHDMNATTVLPAIVYPTSYKIFWGYSCDIWFPVYLLIICLYVYVIYILCTSKSSKYKSAYFSIFVCTGVADIIDAIAIEYIRFSQRVGMGPSFGWLLQITTAITGSNFAMHLIGNSLMSTFQFTAVWLPIFHNSFWKDRNTRIIMGVMVVVPIIVYGHLLFTEFIFIQDDMGRWRYKSRIDPITKTRILDSVLTVVQALISGSLSICTIVGIRMKTDGNFKKNLPEKSLVLVELINVAFGSMETLYGFISLFNIPLTNPFLVFIFDEFVSYFFLMVTLNAFTLPLLSATMRTEIAHRIWGKSMSAVVTVVERSASNAKTQK